jgi:hypothetical protein
MRTKGSKDSFKRKGRAQMEFLNYERVYTVRGQKNGQKVPYGVIYLPDEMIGKKVTLIVVLEKDYNLITQSEREYSPRRKK